MFSTVLARTVFWLGIAIPAQAEGNDEQSRGLVSVPRSGGADEAAEFVIRALRDSRNADAPPTEQVAAALAESGSRGLESMLEILVVRRISALLPTEREQVLSVPQRRLLLESLSHHGVTAIDRIEGRLENEHTVDVRIAAVYVYAAAGESRDLARVLELALEEEEQVLEPAMEEALQYAVAQILVRHPEGFSSLGYSIGFARPEIHRALFFAIGSTKDPRGVEVIADLLPLHPEIVDVAVAQARLLGRSSDPAINARLAVEIMPFLGGERVELACAVARTLGELGACDSVPQLIELLESPSAPLREDAHWALKRMSRRNYPATRQAWERWYDSEQEWWEARSQAEFAELERGTRKERLLTLQSLGDRSLHRDEIAMFVADALTQSDAAIRKRACQTLGQLGSPTGARTLASALDDGDLEVRVAARAALAEIYSVEIPEWPEACIQLLRL